MKACGAIKSIKAADNDIKFNENLLLFALIYQLFKYNYI